ncbi:hypothetical protein CYMTET_43396 [Cymbomonas tetramitiformis]|uniref:protein-serine/threonine phosphatase n=1 Tax=Cymbomonas tetramitiformis TaxID=36881 RepID=A0AAE0C254_9CHLO|nr:hypothetical protein CYMTET_43396 [Cymbomonas tetramitiformis]
MEDTHKMIPVHKIPKDCSSEQHAKFSFFGVFDGHAGVKAAEYAEENLFLNFVNHSKAYANPEVALRDSFELTESGFREIALEKGFMDGTTAVVAVLVDDRLVVGNVGDSELVLCRGRTAMVLTKMHNTKKNKEEAERVKAAGGRIWKDYLGHPKFNPAAVSLAVSRAIGDVFFKDDQFTDGLPSGLTAEPDISVVDITREDRFFIMSCDGLWDVMSSQQAVEVVLGALERGSDADAVSKELVDMAMHMGSKDNITVIVALLSPLDIMALDQQKQQIFS